MEIMEIIEIKRFGFVRHGSKFAKFSAMCGVFIYIFFSLVVLHLGEQP